MDYRINGFEQIKAFYSWVFNNQDEKITTSHVSLYVFLINQNNRNNWVEWFKLPYDLGMNGACIGSRNTYYKCLEDLQNWKLIEYKKGINNWKAPIVKLCLLKNEHLSEQVPVPLSEQLSEQQSIQLSEQLSEHKYKLLTNNIKLITDNLDRVLNFLKPEKKFNFKKSLLELGVNEEILNDWMEVRKMKKASNTKTAYTKFINQVNLSGLTVNECVQICAEKDWKGFEAEWLINLNYKSNGTTTKQPATTIEDLIEINRRHFEAK